MKAMIFAAGLGTRLYPITQNKPKALAPFLQATLLEHAIEYLISYGITEIIINTHHFSDKMQEFIHQLHYDIPLHISHEEVLLDTAGGLMECQQFFQNEESFILYNVDVVSNLDLTKMLHTHQLNNALATLAVRERSTSRYLVFNTENQLVGWKNINTNEEIQAIPWDANVKNFAFSGIHIVKPKIFEYLQKGEVKSLVPFYMEIAAHEKIMAFPEQQSYWFDCGKIDSLKEAEEFVANVTK